MISELSKAKSAAIIGATGDQNSLFGRPLRYLRNMGFAGSIYPVNPKYDDIGGLPCYPAIEELPETVDVALVLVAARRVVDVMHGIGRSGTKYAVVCASGFSETGSTGKSLQDDLTSAAAAYGISFVGPNSQGVYLRQSGLALTFNPAIDRARDFPNSGIVYSGQSGAVGAQVAGLLKRSRLALSSMVSTGNEAQVSAIDLAIECLDLADTRSVIVYAESIARPDRFSELLAASKEAGKPVVLLLGGFSQIARRSAQSHTGSMTPPGSHVRALADYYGVPICQEPAEAAAAAQVLQERGDKSFVVRSPLSARAQVGMLTTSGGSAVLAADLCAGLGVDLPPLAAETVGRLAELIPSFGAADNPVDVTAEMQKAGSDAWLEANRAVANDPNVDILWIAIGYTVGAVGVARSEAIVKLAQVIDKPIIVSWLAPPEDTTEGRALLAAAGIPVLDTLTDTVRTAALLARFRARRGSRLPSAGVRQPEPDAAASDEEIRANLPLRFAASVWADDRAGLDAWLAQRPNPLFVVKGHVPGVTHKSDWGGVVTGVAARDVPGVVESVSAAAEARFGATARVSVEEEIDHAAELLVGFQRGAPGLAPLLLLGWGGYYAEALGDTTTMLCAPDADLISDHLRRLRLAKVLAGFRGGPVFDTEELAASLARLAGAFGRLPGDVTELEINPVALGRDGKTITGLDLLVVRDTAAAGRREGV